MSRFGGIACQFFSFKTKFFKKHAFSDLARLAVAQFRDLSLKIYGVRFVYFDVICNDLCQ